MTFAVHSIYARAVELVDGGMSHAPGVVFSLPEPIETFETMEEAESWRLARVPTPTP